MKLGLVFIICLLLLAECQRLSSAPNSPKTNPRRHGITDEKVALAHKKFGIHGKTPKHKGGPPLASNGTQSTPPDSNNTSSNNGSTASKSKRDNVGGCWTPWPPADTINFINEVTDQDTWDMTWEFYGYDYVNGVQWDYFYTLTGDGFFEKVSVQGWWMNGTLLYNYYGLGAYQYMLNYYSCQWPLPAAIIYYSTMYGSCYQRSLEYIEIYNSGQLVSNGSVNHCSNFNSADLSNLPSNLPPYPPQQAPSC